MNMRSPSLLQEELLNLIDQRVDERLEGTIQRIAKIVEVMAKRYEGSAHDALIDAAAAVRGYSMAYTQGKGGTLPSPVNLERNKEIFAAWQAGETPRDLMGRYGMSLTAVRKVIRRALLAQGAQGPLKVG